MIVALRVLNAITKSEQPDPQDVKELARITSPMAYAALDEMACDVILQAVDGLTEKRSSATAGAESA